MKPGKQLIHLGYFVLLILVLLTIDQAINLLLARNASFFNGYMEDIILRCGIFIILAVSLNLVNGFTGQFSLGHAGFFGLGAYAGALVTTMAQATLLKHFAPPNDNLNWFNGGVIMVISMLCGGMVAAIAGWLVGMPSLKLRGDYLAIVTLGFNKIIYVFLNNTDFVGGSLGFSGYTDSQGNQTAIAGTASFFWVYFIAALVILFSLNLRRSTHGLAYLSIRENEIAAESMGVPTTRIKVTAFVVSAFFAGVAGSLFAHEQKFFKPDNFDIMPSINIVVMVVLGGMGSVSGAAIAAILLIAIPEQLHAIDQYRLVIYSLLLIALMLMRPKGIFGSEELDRKWLQGQRQGIDRIISRLTKTARA